MVEIVKIGPGPIPEALIIRLRSRSVLLSASDCVIEKQLFDLGIDFHHATDDEIEDAILLLIDRPLDQLTQVIDRLLGPGGCPWDQVQTHESLKKYLIEEAYEVLEAIDSGSSENLREELGDLLLQPFMHAQIRKLRTEEFDIDDVARGIVSKLIRRHPHVFGDTKVADADEVLRNWDQIKQGEKSESQAKPSILAGVPKSLPALLRAHEVSKRAARCGFEWPNIEEVFDKLKEEEAELRAELPYGSLDRVESEIGDMLFTVVNLARWTKVDAEEALRKMLDRFTSRFMAMEESATKPLRDLSPEEWDELWNRVKSQLG